MKQSFGKVVWSLYSDKDRKYYRMWVIQEGHRYVFRMTSRTPREKEWVAFERCTVGRAKWWTKVFLVHSESCVPVK